MWKSSDEKIAAYQLMIQQQMALIEIEHDKIANLANSSALLAESLPNTIFAGYYLWKENELVLGPFQGKVSCTRIKMGKGVCGEAIEKQATQIVADVTKHKNYIACDSAARSEIVVPLMKDEKIIGVLDIDSAQTDSYDKVDQQYLEKLVSVLLQQTDFTK